MCLRSSCERKLTLSLGGNDAELTNILNQCVFQWAVLSQLQVIQANAIIAVDAAYHFLEGTDFGVYGRGCENQLDRSQAIIEGSVFSSAVDSVISAAKAKLGPGSVYLQTPLDDRS